MILAFVLAGIGIIAVGMAIETAAEVYHASEQEEILARPLPKHWRPADEEE